MIRGEINIYEAWGWFKLRSLLTFSIPFRMNSFYPPPTKFLFLNDSPTIINYTKQKYQISNYNRITNTDRGFSESKRFPKREREREKNWKLLPLTNNPTLITNPINRRSRISISYRPLPVPILPPSRIPLIIGERDRRIVRWREIGFRLHHRYRVARPEPSFPPPPSLAENSARWPGLEAGGEERGAWSEGCERVSTPAANFHGLWARKSTRGRNYRTNLI